MAARKYFVIPRSLPGVRLVLAVFLLSALVLTGCSGMAAFKEGNALLAAGKTDEGMSKLEEAVKADPRNAEYRIALNSRRADLINRLTAAAETARREGRLTDAEKAYRQIQTYDSVHAFAKQGLDALAVERRHRQIVIEAEAMYKKGGGTDLTDALEKLRPVLSENPNQKDAINLKARIDEVRAKEAKPEAKLATSYQKPISLEFRDAPINSVFHLISKVSGLNFYFDKDIRPDLKTTILAKNTSIEDAIRLLLVTNQLEQKILNENSILIYPSTPQKLKDYQPLSVRTFYLTNADVKAVSNTIKTLVKTKDLVIDERLGLIMMRDTPDAIRMAERLVALQDLSDPEVMLEVEVLEIKRSRLLELGISWPSQLTLSPIQSTSSPLTVNGLRNLSGDTISATIGSLVVNANKTEGDGNILANPRIRVRNKEKAKILIGDRVPVITTTSTATGFASESVSYIDVGLKLEVEPSIYLDEEVAIKINLEVSTIVNQVLSKAGSLSYQIGTRGANTVLRLKDGETQILAGLISENDQTTANKIPLLGEIPILSRLFGSQKDNTDRSEILLSITPRIVRAIRRPELQMADFESGTETNIGSMPLRLSAATPLKMTAEPSKEAPVATVETKDGVAVSDKETISQSTNVNANQPGSDRGVVDSSQTNSGVTGFAWQAPAQVKVGEQFSAVLRINSQAALRGIPLLVGFDPQILQMANVQEGDFLKQNGGQTSFTQRVDPAQGMIYITSIRLNDVGNDSGTNGAGSVATVTFKALKAGAAKVQLLSASPEVATSGSSKAAAKLPVEQVIQITP